MDYFLGQILVSDIVIGIMDIITNCAQQFLANLDLNPIQIYSMVPNIKKSALGLGRACQQLGSEPILEPMMTKIFDSDFSLGAKNS